MLPDLYRLLELEPLVADRASIEAALRRLVLQARTLAASEPKQAQRLAKIVELGKRNLLSSEHKRAYDHFWQKNFQPQLQAVTQDESEWDWSRLEPLLPTGDPDQAFNLADFLETAVLPQPSFDADFLKLQSLLNGEASATTESHPAEPSHPVSGTGSPGMMADPQGVAADTVVSPATSASNPRATRMRPTKSLAQQLRSKRDRKYLSIIGGVLFSLGVLLAMLFWLNNPPLHTPATQGTVVASAVPAAPAVERAPADQRRPRGSGLPQVQGLLDSPTVGEIFGEDVPDESIAAESIPAGEGIAGEDDSSAADTTQMSLPNMSPADPAPSANEPAAMDTATMERPAESSAAEQPLPQPPLTEEEKQAWIASMKEIREMLGQHEFAEASERLLEVEQLAKTSQQKAQFARLESLAKLAEEFHAALISAITDLGPGETFKVKSTDVSFVEGSDKHISIRLSGVNKRYDLVEMPVFLAFGLADLKLDLIHPSSLARKAAFAVVHPNSNDLALNQARAMLTEAIAKKAVAEDMLEIFEDDNPL